MAYKIAKHISQFSLVDLLETLMDKQNPLFIEAKSELEKRHPSEEELQEAKRGLDLRFKARNAPLTFWEKLKFLVLPFLHSSFSDSQESYENALKDFEAYKETRKIKQIRNLQVISVLIYFIVVLIFFIFYYSV